MECPDHTKKSPKRKLSKNIDNNLPPKKRKFSLRKRDVQLTCADVWDVIMDHLGPCDCARLMMTSAGLYNVGRNSARWLRYYRVCSGTEQTAPFAQHEPLRYTNCEAEGYTYAPTAAIEDGNVGPFVSWSIRGPYIMHFQQEAYPPARPWPMFMQHVCSQPHHYPRGIKVNRMASFADWHKRFCKWA